MTKGRIVWVLLVACLVGGTAIRLLHLNEPPSDWNTARQYNSALLARFMVAQDMDRWPAWKKDVAASSMGVVQRAELPIMESISAAIYKRLGKEVFWAPRLVALLSWVLGGVCLFAIARRLYAFESGLVAMAFYLFLPFGYDASRSLQPDAMMVLGLLASVYAALWYFERPSRPRLLVAGIVAGGAILVKPGVSQFAIWAVFLGLSMQAHGLRRSFTSLPLYVYGLLSVLPGGIYAVQSAINMGGGFMRVGASNFVHHIVFTLYFWKGWAGILLHILGPLVLVLAASGFVLTRGKKPRAVLWGLGVGYVAQCMLTVYTTASHDYWHLQVVPFTALCLAGLVFALFDYSSRKGQLMVIRVALIFVVGLWAGTQVYGRLMQDGASDGHDHFQRIAEDIGEATQHSGRSIILAYDYGRPLCYFAWIGGRYWPSSTDLWAETLREDRVISPQERFDRDYADMNPEYFVVSRCFEELRDQEGLKTFLDDNFAVHAQSGYYVIYKAMRDDGDATP